MRARRVPGSTPAGLLLSALLVASGCGARHPDVRGPSAAGSHAAPDTAPLVVWNARWFPVVDDAEPRVSELDVDGSARVVERGLRLVEHPDGRLERAADLLPDATPLGALSLPPRLGGGFVFYVSSDETTRLWRAARFTDKLVPLVRLPFEAAELRAGLDRLYAVSARTRAVVGVDPLTGALVGSGSLPPSPSYGGMAFADGWLGAVEVDVRGALVTFDAGVTFHPVRAPMTVPGVFEQGGRVVLSTARGAFALRPSGDLERVDGPVPDAGVGEPPSANASSDDDSGSDEGDGDTMPHEGVLGARPLEATVLRGMPDSDSTAVVVANGALARVDLRDGRILSLVAHAVPAGASCRGVRLFAGIGFVCGESRGRTTIYSYRPPTGLEPVMSFREPRVVSAGGTGALTISGSCSEAAPSSDALYCILSRAGRTREIRVRGDVGAERVVALSDGRAVVVVPPRFGVPGQLSLVGEDGRSETVPLTVEGVPLDAQKLLMRGLWLRGMTEVEQGRLGAWVAGSSSFMGIRVGLAGKIAAGTLREGLGRASLSGEFGLVTDEHGGGRQTTDFGMTWFDLALPASADPGAAIASDHERGCGPVGCSIGSWLRVGWSKGSDSVALAVGVEPPRAKFPAAPFVGWALECSPTGETEGPREASNRVRNKAAYAQKMTPAADSSKSALADLDSSAFRAFLGVPPPARAPDDLGFDFGTEDQTIQVRGYAWGARTAAWDRAGSWMVRVANRFAVRQSIWSTAPSRTPWPDAGAAAEMFGSDPSHRVSSEWFPFLDPASEGGVVVLRAGTTTELAIIERDRAIIVVRNAEDLLGDRPLAGAVEVDGKWFLGFVPASRAFQILGVDGGTLSALSSYPRYSDEGDVRVVRTASGGGLGIWVVAHGQDGTRSGGDTWFVYPVDPRTGVASAPRIASREELAHAPRPCDPEEDGWVLAYDISASIAKLEFAHVTETPSITRLASRLKLGSRGLCLDALAAQVDGDPPKDLKMRGAPSWPVRSTTLALSDRVTDRRWGFRCAP